MKYTCPVCGYKTFNEPAGSDEICGVCTWHDDVSQLIYPEELGANKVNLIQAQKNFKRFGVYKFSIFAFLMPRPGKRYFEKDSEWRPFDPNIDELQQSPAGKNYLDKVADASESINPYYWKQKR